MCTITDDGLIRVAVTCCDLLEKDKCNGSTGMRISTLAIGASLLMTVLNKEICT